MARTFEFRKRNSIEKLSMGVTVEVDNQRNCLVMCLDQMAGFAITNYSINLCMNELFVAACC